MIYSFVLIDRANAVEIRQSVVSDHRKYIAEIADRIAFAGALMDDDGTTIVGSLLAIEFADRQAALEWLQNEPFMKAGLYASTQVLAFANRWPQMTGFPSR